MDVTLEPTECIQLDWIELLGSGHDADSDGPEMRPNGQEESALQGAGGDLEARATRVDVTVWSTHTLYKT